MSRLFVARKLGRGIELEVRLAADPATSDIVAILGAVHRQSRPIEGLSGRSFRAKRRLSSSPTLAMATPNGTKAAIAIAATVMPAR